ncbi:STAS/SEC14 domain-containing protein [Paenarthrobacter sp. YJN-D]|jgi:hypothetical protein|uniref:DUF7793 family protein n=1 Tax=Paenarthrobacter TaxID=1742992 RepID=UPI000D7D0E25|nr:STAS/SEC14 domain-containing protein [Paenarthrobacter sp. YJN-D]BCW11855.1 hypothetical protein NtRootA2_31370 [Arthrobacter sp. NtRootA2]BCW15939.1 hypothetical protein NtRootA4_29180 [Arthrobacter sp. NtRootA4]BCW24272.1 hypothetical protein NtRootC7_31390 [Arthrobacter sp. NtRootC7]BCW28540.1 hypothetical protein NtRootC45_31400 [Arthrobacter sp. NtRootC45]BCW32811.1 hypothetical protein NtRootD5_31420 [Arthrobacter sp. NtRootD5]
MEQIELDDSVLRLEKGVLHLVWNHGVRIEAGNARAAVDAVNRLANGRKLPLLVDMAATGFLSRRAREVFEEPCAASRIALLGESPVDRTVVQYQLHTSKVPCPTMFFTSRLEALGWLAEASTAEGASVSAGRPTGFR